MIQKKDIPGYENFYECSENGSIFSKGRIDPLGRYWPPKKLKPIANNTYLYVSLFNESKEKRFAIHRIVATLFIANPYKKRCVNHKNGIKDDNRKKNLEWVTHSENNIHAYSIGLHKAACGVHNKRSIPIKQFDLSGNLIKEHESIKEAARLLNKNHGSISNAVNGITKTAYGYKWKFKN